MTSRMHHRASPLRVRLVIWPAILLLMALLDGHDRAMQGLRLLAVYWAIMAPVLLLHLHLDRKESK